MKKVMKQENNNRKKIDLYEKLIYKIINKNINYINEEIDIYHFEKFLNNNIKKSKIISQLLPAILFLIITLICVIIIYVLDMEKKLIICVCMYGLFFFIMFVLLIIQIYIKKIKVIYISKGYRKGFKNISNEQFNDIKKYIKNMKDNKY